MRNLVRLALLVPALLVLALASCSAGGGDEDAGASTDTLTRRQKDSLISTMPIPGAGGVGRALDAADSATARAARHDSLLNR